MPDKKRNFTVEKSDNGFTGGLYTGHSPTSAAKKSASKIFDKSHKGNTVHFVLRETTQGSKKKMYKYKAILHKHNPPLKVMIAGKEVLIKKKIDIKSDK